MKILYIFPHPSDEAFGPAAAIHKQIKAGHEVFLLTLTKGEASQSRVNLGYTKQELAKAKLMEILHVQKQLRISNLKVLDYMDGELIKADYAFLKKTIETYIIKVKPDIIVTFPYHGLNCHPDNIVTHEVVKDAFNELKDELFDLKRLAFFTLPNDEHTNKINNTLFKTDLRDIQCVIKLLPENVEMLKTVIECYETQRATFEAHNVMELIGRQIHFQIYQEALPHILSELTWFDSGEEENLYSYPTFV